MWPKPNSKSNSKSHSPSCPGSECTPPSKSFTGCALYPIASLSPSSVSQPGHTDILFQTILLGAAGMGEAGCAVHCRMFSSIPGLYALAVMSEEAAPAPRGF